MATVKEIHDEYYAQFRGQGDSLPTFGNREFTLGIYLLRSAIKKWERADGQLWRELITSLSDAKVLDNTIIDTIAGEVTNAPSNMRKPPAWVFFTKPSGEVARYKVVEPQDGATTNVWFEGGANTGYVMHIGSQIVGQLIGAAIDYRYYKKATLPSVTVDPSATFIEMSDPNFAIQYMLSGRFQNTRNGFGYKTAKFEADTALANMKIENNSGVYGNSEEVLGDSGWGMPITGGFGSMEL